jgi:hypothetical protein
MDHRILEGCAGGDPLADETVAEIFQTGTLAANAAHGTGSKTTRSSVWLAMEVYCYLELTRDFATDVAGSSEASAFS